MSVLQPQPQPTTNNQQAQLKLIDFGLSRTCLKGDVMTAMAGSSFYVAPEVLRGHYTTASDLWSLGAITFMLVTGG